MGFVGGHADAVISRGRQILILISESRRETTDGGGGGTSGSKILVQQKKKVSGNKSELQYAGHACMRRPLADCWLLVLAVGCWLLQ